MADTTCPVRSVVQISSTKIGLQTPFLDALVQTHLLKIFLGVPDREDWKRINCFMSVEVSGRWYIFFNIIL
jgi:hypothetical protein